MTTLVIPFWCIHVTSLTTTMSARPSLLKIMFNNFKEIKKPILKIIWWIKSYTLHYFIINHGAIERLWSLVLALIVCVHRVLLCNVWLHMMKLHNYVLGSAIFIVVMVIITSSSMGYNNGFHKMWVELYFAFQRYINLTVHIITIYSARTSM